MENNIPTAEEFFKQCFEGYHPSQYEELHEVQKTRAEFAIIEFAKLHVEECKKRILEDAYGLYYEDKLDYNPSYVKPEKDSILNAYPLTNIK